MKIAAIISVTDKDDRASGCLEEVQRQIDSIEAEGKYHFSIFLNSDGRAGFQKVWEKASAEGFDFYLWIDYDLVPREDAIGVLLENSEFLRHKSIITATVCGPDKAPVFGGRNKRGKLLEPDPVIPVPCAFFDMDFALVPGYAFSCLENPSDMFRERQFDHGYGARAAKAGVKRVVAPGVLATCSGKAEPRLLQDIVREDYHSRGFFHALQLAMALYIKALFTSRPKDG